MKQYDKKNLSVLLMIVLLIMFFQSMTNGGSIISWIILGFFTYPSDFSMSRDGVDLLKAFGPFFISIILTITGIYRFIKWLVNRHKFD